MCQRVLLVRPNVALDDVAVVFLDPIVAGPVVVVLIARGDGAGGGAG